MPGEHLARVGINLAVANRSDSSSFEAEVKPSHPAEEGGVRELAHRITSRAPCDAILRISFQHESQISRLPFSFRGENRAAQYTQRIEALILRSPRLCLRG